VLFVVADEAPSSDHPAEGSLDNLAAWQDLEAGLLVATATISRTKSR